MLIIKKVKMQQHTGCIFTWYICYEFQWKQEWARRGLCH